MFSTKFYVDTTRKDSLMLRITNNRKKVEMSMGLKISPDELEAALSGSSRNIRLEKMLASWTSQIKDLMLELADKKETDKDVKEIRVILQERLLGFAPTQQPKDEKPEGNFTAYFQNFIDGKENKGTKGVYKHTLDKIRSFDPDVDMKRFEDIDLKWLTDFETFCAKTASKNARNIHLRNIRAVFNNAIDYEITSAYPFRRFKIHPEVTRKRSLTVEELRAFIRMDVEGYQQFYKDMFLLSFFFIGINAVDLAKLTCITNDNRIEYDRAKTHRKYSIKVETEALAIINKYRGSSNLLCIADRWSDHRNFLHQLNKALKNMGAVVRVGRGGKKVRTPAFPNLSSYWCRHTWATIAYNDCGISEDIIGQALGHASSHTTTSIYINRNAKLVDEANRRVLDWVLYDKR
ncbi:phage integrase SAM-like domain-containing protein [uncultured Muribaculum sp.]|uniref:phage integrase SAM-like domain-containing protein n=1 Tax=uncultured Muribaculum sp. TaxID=1918613 RepID=UPI00351FDD4D